MKRGYYRPVKLIEGEIIAWKKNTWVVYATNTKIEKKFFVQVGERGYKVTHGQEIVFEGWRLKAAIRAYNKLTKPPKEEDAPKTSN